MLECDDVEHAKSVRVVASQLSPRFVCKWCDFVESSQHV